MEVRNLCLDSLFQNKNSMSYKGEFMVRLLSEVGLWQLDQVGFKHLNSIIGILMCFQLCKI